MQTHCCQSTKNALWKFTKQPSLVAFVADQTPVDTENAYWTKFLHINTPFLKDMMHWQSAINAIVLYASIQKINRGVYEMHLKTITEHPQKEKRKLHCRTICTIIRMRYTKSTTRNIGYGVIEDGNEQA